MRTDEHIDRRQIKWISAAAVLASLLAFAWYYRYGEILLYGDAVAHINIARRVFDCATPGPLQLGTVWLPLPHILMIPFVVDDWMWQSGVGGSIPSMFAYVLGVVGIFRIVQFAAGKRAGWFGAAIFGLNPNILYMQSTAMTETVFLATMIWSVRCMQLFIAAMQGEVDERHYPAERSIRNLTLWLSAAILTRYDGWILAAVCGAIVFWQWRRSASVYLAAYRRLTRPVVGFFLLCALVPLVWLAHNYAITANPLDFMNGPYSAKAIEARSTQPGGPPHPGTGNLLTSAIFFLKSAKLNVATGWLEPLFFALALIGTAFTMWRWRKHGVLLLFWLPLPFYAYSVAYGSVPIFMPVWWPHSYYNVRYGLELLPVFAVFVALVASAARKLNRRAVPIAAAVGVVVVVASYLLVERATPICLSEARVNSSSRLVLEAKLAAILSQLPPKSTILMQTGEYVGALQDAGIHLSRVVWEGNHPAWDNAIAAPADSAEYVVAVQGNDVWYSTRLFPQKLEKVAEFDPPEKPRVTVFRTQKTSGNPDPNTTR